MKHLLTVLFLVSCFTALSVEVAAQRGIRINFRRGAHSAVVTRHLNGYKHKKIYLIRVRPGQTLSTEQVGDRHDITIFIEDPRGRSVGDSDASCNNRREITPTEGGTYQLTVIECKKADPWRGTFKFRVTVK